MRERHAHVSFMCTIIIAALFFSHNAYGEKHVERVPPEPIDIHADKYTKSFKPMWFKTPGHFSRQDWSVLIDSFWGPGLPTYDKLQIFDQFWTVIDSNFACFNNLIVDWDSLRVLYRSEIEDTVSRGRFAAIMNHLTLALKESHTNVQDTLVNRSTALAPGVPLMAVGGWLDNGHFGAGLTPLPDSSLLVYRVVENHPLGLEFGDIVLGYDGIPWKLLVEELITAQLPIYRHAFWGSSDSTIMHSFLMSAGLNWHLFDTIDVAKYASGDTLHLAVSPLIGQSMSLYCTEQMPIPEVPMPEIDSGQAVSYGIVSGTQIGYIYGWIWSYNAENEFYNAVYELVNNPALRGLIIDFRFNMGGNMFLSDSGLYLLFPDTVETICFTHRSDPLNHYAMTIHTPASEYLIPGNGIGYSKPIAVLTGPGAVSSGDQVAFRMKFHPTARLFGKSTATAFNAPTFVDMHPEWYLWYAFAEACLASDTTYFLTHRDLHVDHPVWLTPHCVAQGEDDVVNAAIAWIDSAGVGEDNYITLKRNIMTAHAYPNPTTENVIIDLILANQEAVSAKIYNVLGQEVVELTPEVIDALHHIYRWHDQGAPSGVYFCHITMDSDDSVIKIVKTH